MCARGRTGKQSPSWTVALDNRRVAAPDLDAEDASGGALAEQVDCEDIRPVGKHVEHAQAEVFRVAPVEDDAPTPVRRAVSRRVSPIEEGRTPLAVAMQHQPGDRVEGIGEVTTARRRRAAENEFALLRCPFVSPTHRHAVSGDDERSVRDMGRGPWHEPETIGADEAAMVR